jgi:hypothetical protein
VRVLWGEELTKEGGAVDFDFVTEQGFPDRAAFLAWMAQLSGPGVGEQVAADEAKFPIGHGPGPMSSRNT